MEPIPESADVLESLGRHTGAHLADMLARAGSRVREIVPDCWGMSISVVEADLTLTLVATSAEVLALDAVQYASDGPCLEAIREDRVVSVARIDGGESPLVEEEWRLFASASAAAGVRSTLSFPLRSAGKVVGGVNLYAAAAHAFTDHEPALAAVFGSWASDAVHNADLGFTSRARADAGPERLAEDAAVAQATGVLMAEEGLTADLAASQLTVAARQAGVSPVALARSILSGLEYRRGAHDQSHPEDSTG
jgi:GAF domain-containing protein